MYELAIKDLDKFCEFKLFQIRSCNGRETLVFDDDIYDIKDYLNNKEYAYFNNKVNFKRALRINKDFFEERLPLQDVLCMYKKHNIAFKSTPFVINVEFKNNFEALGKVHFDVMGDFTIFDNIILDTNLKSNIVSFYAHELVHTQVEKNIYYLLENYFDREFLSIFVELVISDFCNPIYNRNTIEKRLEVLKHQFDYYTQNRKDLVVRSYIVSTLKAFHLYDIYISGNNQMKKEILDTIENIFKENISVGILLNKYEIDYDNSKKLKYLKR